MRELKEEMTALSRQEDEHKKRKLDSVSIGCLNAARIKQANFLFTCVESKGNGKKSRFFFCVVIIEIFC